MDEIRRSLEVLEEQYRSLFNKSDKLIEETTDHQFKNDAILQKEIAEMGVNFASILLDILNGLEEKQDKKVIGVSVLDVGSNTEDEVDEILNRFRS